MASLVDSLPLAFFLFISVSSRQIQARENLFFSKAVRYESPKESTYVPKGAYEEQSRNGYGFYGPTVTTNYFYNNNGARRHTPRFTDNMFVDTEIYENKNIVAGYESRSVPFGTVHEGFNSGIFEDGKCRHDANGETRYEYNSGREGYQNDMKNKERQEEFIP